MRTSIIVVAGSIVVVGAAALMAFKGEGAAVASGANATDQRAQVSESKVTQASSALAKRGLPSPPNILVTGFEKPEQIAEAFKEQGENWATRNLVQLPGGDSDECRRQEGSTENTLHIRYRTDYPDNRNGRPTLPYTDIKLPPVGEHGFDFYSPRITEVISRDLYEWRRTYQVHWWYGTDQTWLEPLNARLSELASLDTDTMAEVRAVIVEVDQINRQIRDNPVKALNETIDDRIRVKAPHPGWSFRYNNVAKKGEPPRQNDSRIDYSKYDEEIAQNAGAITAALNDIARLGQQVEQGGQREILGRRCELRRLNDMKVQGCFAEINGQSVSLWQRFDKSERTAVYIDEKPCVPMTQFLPPVDVDFSREE